jgi:hypothetical protein
MATIDLGKIKQVWRGTYNNGTAYTVDDLVAYTDSNITSTYICVANSTGSAPSSSGTAHASWNYVAKGVAGPIPSQSGNSGRALITNGSTASWGTAGKLLNVTEIANGTRAARVSQQTYDMVTGTFTQVAASSKFVVWGSVWWRGDASGEIRYILYYGPNGNMANIDETRSGYAYTNQGHRFFGQGLWYFTGNSSAGTKQILWREHSNDNANERSGQVHNPTNSDDSRISSGGHTTNLVIMEFAA